MDEDLPPTLHPPVPQPTGATTPAREPVMERPHPATPVIKGWMALVALALGFGRDALEDIGRGARDQGDGATWLGIGAGWWVIGGLLLLYVLVTGVFGFFQWRFTRFVVDDREVRIEHNFVWHNSDKVPFTKIQSVDVVQPLAARLLGLAQLRIDVGAGHAKSIEYLARGRAYQMRDYLVERAHGRSTTVAESATGPQADALGDVSEAEQVLLTVPPQRLVLAALLSTNFLVTLALGLVTLGGALWARELGAVVGLVPLATALVGIIGNTVVKQWNYRLVRTRSGALKVSRGMTSLVSQTLPVGRIQGIGITQHLLWRPFGIHRVKVDVLGYGSGDDDDAASDVRLPAGSWAEVERAIDAVWPGFRLADVALQPAPERARRLHPFIWRSLAWGITDEVVVTRNGGLVRHTKVVHHARVQSVHLLQGPLQRRLRLADVKVDTTAGLLSTAVAQELDEQVARALVLEQMDRCREARARDAGMRALDALPRPVAPAPRHAEPAAPDGGARVASPQDLPR